MPFSRSIIADLNFSFTPKTGLWLRWEGGSMRVLLVENDAAMAGSIEIMLKSENFKI
jgi:hypothetical protein